MVCVSDPYNTTLHIIDLIIRIFRFLFSLPLINSFLLQKVSNLIAIVLFIYAHRHRNFQLVPVHFHLPVIIYSCFLSSAYSHDLCPKMFIFIWYFVAMWFSRSMLFCSLFWLPANIVWSTTALSVFINLPPTFSTSMQAHSDSTRLMIFMLQEH